MIWVIVFIVLGLVVLFLVVRAAMHLFRGDELETSSSWEKQAGDDDTR
jgi:hypothetical protein